MKKVVGIVINVILWLFVVFAALTTVVVFTGTSNNGVGNLFGYMPFSIQTQSMEPTIKAGDVVIGKEVDFNTLKEGDIITYWTTVDEQKILNTHRITKVISNGKGSVPSFKTKGDNNQIEDEYTVAAADIVAKYNSKISGLGKAVDFLETQKGFFICIVLPLILFFLYQLYHFIKVIVTVKQENAGLSKEDEEELKKKAVEEYLAKQKEEQEASEEK
ncbi:signal peptidase I [Eubacterium ventriosum]|uniref:Signal peptidase I n=1 Tax=Eubacterium ventriosum TaxID=39496 RepID=A0A413R7F1_9FIRM|nr:signal peptidase I [Eubacterium ventriosum]PWM04273.1 MAG: signal peptidase I [Eubacterium ventriosum]RHA17983.1 signal peptidase I [Eubacterium ventriosum]RHF90655.1 signal peptidase I [Eubacterium ventriosum]